MLSFLFRRFEIKGFLTFFGCEVAQRKHERAVGEEYVDETGRIGGAERRRLSQQ